MRNTCGVITSINRPTKALELFSTKADIQWIVVGDKKTPLDWEYDGIKYLSVNEQIILNERLSLAIPYNHYARKMMGYLYAISTTMCNCIYDTDDDNIPMPNWYIPSFGTHHYNAMHYNGFVNVYQYYTKKKIWPRGLPLRYIGVDFSKQINQLQPKKCQVGIWQGLANGDPDVDAIYRLVLNQPCNFESVTPIVLGKNCISPFNSQNTFFSAVTFPLLYIPSTVSFRFCDILRGLVAQPILWAQNLHLGIMEATVFQERNIHDYYQDFISEIPMYEHVDVIIDLVESNISSRFSCEDNLRLAYEGLAKQKIVHHDELLILDAWLSAIHSK